MESHVTVSYTTENIGTIMEVRHKWAPITHKQLFLWTNVCLSHYHCGSNTLPALAIPYGTVQSLICPLLSHTHEHHINLKLCEWAGLLPINSYWKTSQPSETHCTWKCTRNIPCLMLLSSWTHLFHPKILISKRTLQRGLQIPTDKTRILFYPFVCRVLPHWVLQL